MSPEDKFAKFLAENRPQAPRAPHDQSAVIWSKIDGARSQPTFPMRPYIAFSAMAIAGLVAFLILSPSVKEEALSVDELAQVLLIEEDIDESGSDAWIEIAYDLN